MLKGFFVDDERHPDDVTWIKYPEINWHRIIRDGQEFTQALPEIVESSQILVSFDHDLGLDTADGYDLVKQLCEYLMDHHEATLPEVYFHTQNPVGLRNMSLYWKNFLCYASDK